MRKKDGNYHLVLKAGNGQVILTALGPYGSKAACENIILSIRKNSEDDNRFFRDTYKDGSPYFLLKANNGQTIGRSEFYSSTAAMENAIMSVKKNAPDAKVVELL